MRTHSLLHRLASLALLCITFGAFSISGASPAHADGTPLQAQFTFHCSQVGGSVDWKVLNPDAKDHVIHFVIKEASGKTTGNITLDAATTGWLGHRDVNDGESISIQLSENGNVFADTGKQIADASFSNCFVNDFAKATVAVQFSFECSDAGTGTAFFITGINQDGQAHPLDVARSLDGAPFEKFGDMLPPPFDADMLDDFVPFGHTVRYRVSEQGNVIDTTQLMTTIANGKSCAVTGVSPIDGGHDGPPATEPPVTEPPVTAPDPVEATQVKGVHHVAAPASPALPRTGAMHTGVEALAGVALVLIGLALVRRGRRLA